MLRTALKSSRTCSLGSSSTLSSSWPMVMRPGWRMKLVMYRCENTAMTIWQSMRSVMPPCPGMVSLKSLILNARLNPLAKKPPKGAMRLAKDASTMACTWNHEARTVSSPNTARAACATQPCGTIQPSTASTPPTMDDTGTSVIMNSGSGSHVAAPPMSVRGPVLGHTSHLYRCSHCAARGDTASVMAKPPMKPSHVFLGEIWMSGVRPKKKPHR
mmetsp:Transcript_6415/g.16369  ORF Transcript_6415/g.16369 Transcript_6415/m.16369 type:complete len:215 (-) Transcript_6415:1141-1785(-)